MAGSKLVGICLECIGDKSLKRALRKRARTRRCRFCRTIRLGVSIEVLAEETEDTLRQFLTLGEVVPRFTSDSDSPSWEQEGESLDWILQEELGIDYEPAKLLAQALCDRDPANPADGDEPFFTSDQQYNRFEVGSWEYAGKWEAFSKAIKFERRLFDSEARERLERILGGPESPKSRRLPVTTLREQVLYRARVIQSTDDARRIRRAPWKELGPPPTSLARAGRMNPGGIVVFYGALSELTAVSEVRPSVGGIVAVGGFRPRRPLRVLDLTRLSEVRTGSLFHPNYQDKAARRAFLAQFHSRIAKPIQPHEEHLEYVPTQAVAQYVANVLKLDGILFASAQVGEVRDEDDEGDDSPTAAENCNVVLFHMAAAVAPPRRTFGIGRTDPALAYIRKSARSVRVRRMQFMIEPYFDWELLTPHVGATPSLSKGARGSSQDNLSF